MNDMTRRFRLRVHVGLREYDRFPKDDDAIGMRLFGMLTDAMERGNPKPAMLALTSARVEQFDLAPLMNVKPRQREMLLSAIAGRPDMECVAVVGVLRRSTRQRGANASKPVGPRVAAVLIEWADNRWWMAWQTINEKGELLGEEPEIRRAVEGWPRPGGIGGWFARARRMGLRLKMETSIPQTGLYSVH